MTVRLTGFDADGLRRLADILERPSLGQIEADESGRGRAAFTEATRRVAVELDDEIAELIVSAGLLELGPTRESETVVRVATRPIVWVAASHERAAAACRQSDIQDRTALLVYDEHSAERLRGRMVHASDVVWVEPVSPAIEKRVRMVIIPPEAESDLD